MPVTQEQVVHALRSVSDPETARDIVSVHPIKSIKIFDAIVSIEIVSHSAAKDRLRAAIAQAVQKIPGVEEVFVDFSAPAAKPSPSTPAGGSHATNASHRQRGPAQPPRGLPRVKHIVAVGAGKGGVGKSTVAVNLALALAIRGKNVGILDGDIYGPSIPTLTGIPPQPPHIVVDRFIPFTIADPSNPKIMLPVMSIGFMVDREKALIWRGPMAHGAMKQMIEQVEWTQSPESPGHGGPHAELDYLIVDLPPGTGDVSLTLAQTVPLTGAVVVATPQEVALADARRAVRMFQQLGVEILGVVENMSYFVCEHGTAYDIFGKGGAKQMAQQMGLPFLGDLPIDVALRKHSDEGTPFANFAENSASRGPLLTLADNLDKAVAIRMVMRPEAKPLTLQIS